MGNGGLGHAGELLLVHVEARFAVAILGISMGQARPPGGLAILVETGIRVLQRGRVKDVLARCPGQVETAQGTMKLRRHRRVLGAVLEDDLDAAPLLPVAKSLDPDHDGKGLSRRVGGLGHNLDVVRQVIARRPAVDHAVPL